MCETEDHGHIDPLDLPATSALKYSRTNDSVLTV